ncbi:hypothetical protein ACSCBZ_24690 [Streptomyces niveiscabiei]|uniref:hypothetical protein n=1 Tax=Streptomyces niveiscabiei TaxID=164115 RepID=UPI0006EBD088|nr:hypothetical protein [Streptomyces niveiscabiei]
MTDHAYTDDDLRAEAAHQVSSKAAAHVLWHERLGGYEPGSFVKKLLALWAWADDENAARLTASWPEYGAAIALMKQPNGAAELRAIAERL